MPIAAFVENLDSVEDHLRSLYEEKEIAGIGKRFVLQIEGVTNHPDVLGLKNAHERQKQENRALKEKVGPLEARLEGIPDDFNVDKFNELTEAANKGGRPSEDQIRMIRQEAQNEFTQKLRPKDDRIQFLETDIRKRVVEDGLTNALVKAGVDSKLLPAARAYLKDTGSVKMVEEDGKFRATVETEIGPQSLEDYVGRWAQSDDGKPFVARATGGDANGGEPRPAVTGNPFNKQNGAKPNMTEIQTLVMKDRNKAIGLARQAGWSDSDLKPLGLA